MKVFLLFDVAKNLFMMNSGSSLTISNSMKKMLNAFRFFIFLSFIFPYFFYSYG